MKDPIEIGPISFNFEARSFKFKGQAIYLTLKEAEILAALVANANCFVTGTQLSRIIHGGEHINLRSLNTLMYTLRKKISCIDVDGLSIISEGSNYALVIRKDVDALL